MLDLKKEYLKEIQSILSQQVPECEARIFGSRIRGKARPYSDVDVVLIAPKKMDWRRLERIKEIFSSSNIPMKVDLLDWHDLSEDFKTLIAAKYEVIQKPQINLG